MKKFLLPVFILIVGVMLSCGGSEAPDYATVSFFIGEVTKNGKPVVIGDTVSESDVIVTGARSSCDLKIGGSVIRIKQSSELKFASLINGADGENTVLDLGEGKLLCKPKKLLKNDRFTVKTPTAVAAVRGTQFTVESDIAKTTRIKVYNGKVKVAKRVKALDNKVDQVVEAADPVGSQESVIVTEKEAKAAEKKVEQAMKNNQNVDDVIEQVNDDIAVKKDDVQQFDVKDFAKEDQSGIIAIAEKPAPVQKEIKKAIAAEKKQPKPKKEEKIVPVGRLLITRYEMYYIKNGQIEWEGRVVSDPVKASGMVYAVAEDYVFCATSEGPVMWKVKMINDGKITVVDNKVVVTVKGEQVYLDAKTGKRLEK